MTKEINMNTESKLRIKQTYGEERKLEIIFHCNTKMDEYNKDKERIIKLLLEVLDSNKNKEKQKWLFQDAEEEEHDVVIMSLEVQN